MLMEIKLQTSLKLHKGSLIKLKTCDQTTGSHMRTCVCHAVAILETQRNVVHELAK